MPDTSCWNCKTPYPSGGACCPACGCTNKTLDSPIVKILANAEEIIVGLRNKIRERDDAIAEACAIFLHGNSLPTDEYIERRNKWRDQFDRAGK